MRKEILLAIIAGGAFGLLIAFGVWKVNADLRASKDNSVVQTVTPIPGNATASPLATTIGELKVVLAKPDSQAVFTETPVSIIGATKPKVNVVISGEDSDTITNANDSGSFTADINLIGGANQILASAFDSDGSTANTHLLIVYSSQFTQEASASGQAISYIGTVTDITDSIIQIKNATGDIQQVKAIANAIFIDTRGNINKQIKASDVAIGDYLIAMGVKGANNILSSSRILVTDPLAKPIRRAFYGIVNDDSGINKFTMKNPKTGEIITVTPALGITITGIEKSFGKIANDEKVIAVGEFKDGVMTARTIRVLQ
jgi:hypothetical protein